MHIEDIVKEYLRKTDEELLQLAMDSEQLTSAAQTALTNELAKRRINVAERPKVFRDEGNRPRLERRADSAPLSSRDSHQVGQFLTEVLRVYNNHFWLFVKLIAPAVIIGYIAVVTGGYEAREIARRIPWGPQVLSTKPRCSKFSS
jgi:hypothetical protein